MALPQLEEFDLEGAVEYLDYGVDELSLHLHKGAIRLGITTEGALDYDFAVLLADLPLRIQREVTGALADGNFVDIHEADYDGSESTGLCIQSSLCLPESREQTAAIWLISRANYSRVPELRWSTPYHLAQW